MRTMLALDALGKLTSFEAFPSRSGLLGRACHISSIPPSYFPDYKEQLGSTPRWQTRFVIRIMLARSWIRNQKKAMVNRLVE